MSLLPGAEPFFYKHSQSSDTVVLLIHGFTSTCYSMHELGTTIFESGLDTRGILLPGHGTQWQDLERTSWNDWYTAVEFTFLELKKTYKRVFICGQSMGGSIGLLLSTYRPLDGIIALGSGVKIFNRTLFFLPVIKYFIPYIKKQNGPDIKDKIAGQKEIHYHEMPTKSIDQLQKLLKQLRKRLPQVNCPVLLIHGRQDHTFAYSNMETILNNITSQEKRGITLENTYHLVSLDFDKDFVQKECIRFIKQMTSSL